jgi:hypothetical protein
MLTLAQINAETDAALTDEQVMALSLVVKQYEPYKQAIGKWPDIEGVLDEIKTAQEGTPTDKSPTQTKALKAVLAALGKLPNIVVESEGTDDSSGFFGTKANWDALAQDILNILYPTEQILGAQSILVVQRRIKNITLGDEY